VQKLLRVIWTRARGCWGAGTTNPDKKNFTTFSPYSSVCLYVDFVLRLRDLLSSAQHTTTPPLPPPAIARETNYLAVVWWKWPCSLDGRIQQ